MALSPEQRHKLEVAADVEAVFDDLLRKYSREGDREMVYNARCLKERTVEYAAEMRGYESLLE